MLQTILNSSINQEWNILIGNIRECLLQCQINPEKYQMFYWVGTIWLHIPVVDHWFCLFSVNLYIFLPCRHVVAWPLETLPTLLYTIEHGLVGQLLAMHSQLLNFYLYSHAILHTAWMWYMHFLDWQSILIHLYMLPKKDFKMAYEDLCIIIVMYRKIFPGDKGWIPKSVNEFPSALSRQWNLVYDLVWYNAWS